MGYTFPDFFLCSCCETKLLAKFINVGREFFTVKSEIDPYKTIS